tara:strand:- start:392 stop:829 length:438 start_codon:yes stop_codon:yes gene_type:complete
VKNKELSNQFLDISEDILDKLKIGNFSDTKNNQLLFLVCIENSLMHLANDIFDTFQNELKPIKDLNYKSKWYEISNVMALKNIILKELDSDGVINQIEKSKNIIFRENDENLITRSETNDLKKFILILDKCKAFQEILRKTLYEC